MVIGKRDHVFPSIAGESAQPVEVNQVAGWQLVLLSMLVAVRPSHRYTRDFRFNGLACVDLSIQRTASIGDNGPCNGLKQEAVFIRYLLCYSDKDFASPVRRVGLNPCRNQIHDLFL